MSKIQVAEPDPSYSNDHEVWLNPDDTPFGGLRIGSGGTKEEALLAAARDLVQAIDVIHHQLFAEQSAIKRKGGTGD